MKKIVLFLILLCIPVSSFAFMAELEGYICVDLHNSLLMREILRNKDVEAYYEMQKQKNCVYVKGKTFACENIGGGILKVRVPGTLEYLYTNTGILYDIKR